MKTEFFDLTDTLARELKADEVLLSSVSGERSDFVRFNHALVRQAGTVAQAYLSIRLIRDQRQASAIVSLAAGPDDLERARSALARLRETLKQLPQDPWLLIAEEPRSTSSERRGRLASTEDVVERVTSRARGHDFVGFYAAGTMYRGLANSYGQRNWHEVDTFSFDWSVYLQSDKAVKSGYAGFDWDAALFETRLRDSTERLRLLETPAITLQPGEYRVYLAPRALEEVTGLLQYDAFSARARATRQSPLLRMELGERLSPKVTLVESSEGIAPQFQYDGFIKPASIPLIQDGALAQALVSPRSAKEYGLSTNGANGRETPESLDFAAGDLPMGDVLKALGTGLYIGNLWYLNFSDRPAARMTGMTRFATFWVENGRILAPVNALRFDDTLYRMLGDKLLDLTRERELLLSTSTYDERSTSSAHVPGALLESLRFTL